MNIKIFIGFLVGWILSGYLGFKYGDSRGYEAGYNEGYRYDCKEEIAELYTKVKHQTTALLFTDSVIRSVFHENDSLKRKEFYQKRYEDSIAISNRFSFDSLRYARVATLYSDSVAKSLGVSSVNLVQSNGRINPFVCSFVKAYRDIDECKDGFGIISRLEAKIRKSKKRKK